MPQPTYQMLRDFMALPEQERMVVAQHPTLGPMLQDFLDAGGEGRRDILDALRPVEATGGSLSTLTSSSPSGAGSFLSDLASGAGRRIAGQGQNALDVAKAVLTPPKWMPERGEHALPPFPGGNVVEKGLNIARLAPPWAVGEWLTHVLAGGPGEAISKAMGNDPATAQSHGDLAELPAALLSGLLQTGVSNVATALQRSGIGRPGAGQKAKILQDAMKAEIPSRTPANIPLTYSDQLEQILNNPQSDDNLRALLNVLNQGGKKPKVDKVFKKLSNLRQPGDAVARQDMGNLSRVTSPSVEELLQVEQQAARRAGNLMPPEGVPTAPPMTEPQRAALGVRMEAEAQAVNEARAAEAADVALRQRRLVEQGVPPEVPVTPARPPSGPTIIPKGIPPHQTEEQLIKQAIAEAELRLPVHPGPTRPGTSVVGPTAEMQPDAILLKKMRDAAEGRLPGPPGLAPTTKATPLSLVARPGKVAPTREKAGTPGPARPVSPQVEHGDLLAGFKQTDPEPPRLPLKTVDAPWVEEFKGIGGQIDPDGTVVLWHATTKENAVRIAKEGLLRRPSDAPDSYGVYLSSSRDVAHDYGDGTLVPVRVKARDLSPDDVFPGSRMDFSIKTKGGAYKPVALGDDAIRSTKPPTKLPLGDEPTGTADLGMGLPIPKSVRKAVRYFFTGEEDPGAVSHSFMNYRHLLNRTLGVDPTTKKGIGDLADESFLSSLRHAGRWDDALDRAKLSKLTEAENVNLMQAIERRAQPINQRVRDAMAAIVTQDQADAALLAKGGALVRRDAIYDSTTGARIRDASYKPFQAVHHHYPRYLDPRLIVKYDETQLANIIRNAPYAKNRAIDAATAQDMARALIAQAKGDAVPSSIGTSAKRILRLGQPLTEALHERNPFWVIPDEILTRPVDALPRLASDISRELGWLEHVGPGYQKIESAIVRARELGRPDVEMAVQAWDRLRGGAIQNPLDTTVNKVIQVGKSAATSTLISDLTGIKQLSQGFRLLGSDVRWRHSFGQLRHAFSKAGMRESKLMGALLDSVRSDMELMTPLRDRFLPSDTGLDRAVKIGNRTAGVVVKASGSIFTDAKMRSWAAHAAKADFTAYQREAVNGGKKALAMLSRYGLTPQSSVAEIERAAQRLSLRINYRADPLAIPGLFFHNSVGSLMSTLNKFNIGVVSDLRQNFIIPAGKAAARHDWPELARQLGRTAKYLAVMGVGGEAITDTILTLRGRPDDRPGGTLPEFLDDLAAGRVKPWSAVAWKRFTDNVANAGTYGAISMAQQVLSAPTGAKEKAARIFGIVGGAALGTGAEVIGHGVELATADRTPGARSKKSDYDRAREAALGSLARRVPVVGPHVQDFARHIGIVPTPKAPDTTRTAAAIARAEARRDFRSASNLGRDYRQRQRENISQTAVRKARQEYGQ